MRELAERLVEMLREQGPLSPPELARRLLEPEGKIHMEVLLLRQAQRIVISGAAFLYGLVFPEFAQAAQRERGGAQLLCALLGDQAVPSDVLLEKLEQGGVDAQQAGRLLDAGIAARWLRCFWDLQYAVPASHRIAPPGAAEPSEQVHGRLG